MILDRIKEKKEKHSQLISQYNCILNEAQELYNEIVRDSIEYAKKEKLLSKLKWSFSYYGMTSLLGEKGTTIRKKLDDLFEVDYHCHTAFETDVSLIYSDGELCLNFSDEIRMLSFCKENNIIIDTKHLKNQLKQINLDIKGSLIKKDQLEKILKEYNSI